MNLPAPLNPEQKRAAVDLQRRGLTRRTIADRLGVRFGAVGRFLSAVNKRALEKIAEFAAEAKIQQVSQLEWITEEALRGWERSQKDAETLKTTECGDAETKTEITIKSQAGDPRFLWEARGALSEVRGILGIGAALELNREKLDRASPEETTPTVREALEAMQDSAQRYEAENSQPEEPGGDPGGRE